MISGIINLKKEAGMTSHDAVFKLRKILKEKKIHDQLKDVLQKQIDI